MAKNEYKDIKAETLQTFDTLMSGVAEYAQKHGLPLSIVEGGARDLIAQVEAHRMLQALRSRGAKI
jgi:hypothetical protein